MNIPKIASLLLSQIYRPICPVCGEILTRSLQSDQNPFICDACYHKIRFPGEPRCLNCSRPLFDERELVCPNCRKEPLHFDRSVSLMVHDEVSKKLLYDLKYYNRRDNAKMLALEAVRREGYRLLAWKADVIIPVPLHKKREIGRGYNQAFLLAEQVAKYLAESSRNPAHPQPKLPVDNGYLIRTRYTKAQKELTREQRKSNIRKAFAVDSREPQRKYAGKTILLVDDIYTSGATLSECARVLKQSGAGHVFGLTFGIG